MFSVGRFDHADKKKGTSKNQSGKKSIVQESQVKQKIEASKLKKYLSRDTVLSTAKIYINSSFDHEIFRSTPFLA